eukprot:NODE_21386_length_755_cov_58.001592.p3 GENE.NODE_21386_length_755_cov_58.001592~~NODE_21386_length_755_cov_58.001592.p3  ORF type:complete len:113 (-),score=29.34 NODE_21386_length_755_cov_58.001592:301-639(-)
MSRPTAESKGAGWTVRGLLRTGGQHAGAVEFRFKQPGKAEWLPGSAKIPPSVAKTITAAKDKVRATLKARFKGMKATLKTTKKAAPPVKKAAIKSAMKVKPVKTSAMKAKKR